MMEPRHVNSSAYTCCPLLHRNSKTKPAFTVTMDWRYAKQRLNKWKKTKQEVSEIFKANGLKITIEANKKTINFLDVTLDLASGSYKPFMKPNNKILYVHQESNHPPALLKNIPENINKRLTSISSSQKVFDDAIPTYQKALDESGYNHKLTYNPQPTRNRNRKRKVIWYNPPWNATPACLTLRASSRHTTRQSYQISTSHKHKQVTKNATVEKKTSAHWTENA